jgi:hypothetical protein
VQRGSTDVCPTNPIGAKAWNIKIYRITHIEVDIHPLFSLVALEYLWYKNDQ